MRRIGGIILAAGGSVRMGAPKQLLMLQGQPLARVAASSALEGGCDAVCVVTGHEWMSVERAVHGLPVTLARNASWKRGVGGSIRVGLEALPAVSAVLIMACDQPAVDAGVVAALLTRHEQSGRPIVASHYSGTCGIPVLFDQSCFPELRNLPADRGAKMVIQRDPERVEAFDFPGGALDLDSPSDLRAWRARAVSTAHVPACAQRESHREYCSRP